MFFVALLTAPAFFGKLRNPIASLIGGERTGVEGVVRVENVVVENLQDAFEIGFIAVTDHGAPCFHRDLTIHELHPE